MITQEQLPMVAMDSMNDTHLEDIVMINAISKALENQEVEKIVDVLSNYKQCLEESKNSYKQILTATSLFGGVQVFNILLSVIKTKVVSVLIGASGLGVLGLFTTTIKI